MEILSFDIEGKFAHFRKYFANNTAFTFGLPPRTTIMGIIAGAMGLKKDSYYGDFNSNNLKIGISVLSPVKKSFHRLNFLMVKDESDFRGRKKHIQTPFEVVSGIDQRKDFVRYRIFISSSKRKPEIYDQIKEVFVSKSFVYSPTLGIANFTAQISNVKIWDKVDVVYVENEKVSLNSAGISDTISEILFEKNDDFRFSMIEEELMPADFKSDEDREVIKMNRVLFTTGGFALNVKLTGTIYVLHDGEEKQIIQFLE